MLQYGQTVIHPVALGFTLIAGVLMLLLPRRYVMVPFVVAAIFIPIQQRLVIASIDFFMLRILILFGWARLIARYEYRGLRLNTLDKAMILWAAAATISYAFLWETSAALIYKLGLAFDALGSYFIIRCLVRDFQDIQYVIKALAAICVLLAAAMLVERTTGRNAFAVFGGVSEITIVREGRLRCQGAFVHPILAGTFGATLMPLFLSLCWQREGGKALAASGFIAGALITFTSASSGPVIAALAGLVGLSLWLFRRHIRLIRWGFLYTVIALHLYMTAPVWALLARANAVGGSTGYHRYLLFDQFIKHFHEWWLWGVKSTAHWGYYLFDITNQYVLVAVEGGLLTLVLFIAVIVLCYKGIGRGLGVMGTQWRKMCAISSDIVMARVISVQSYLRSEQRRIFTDIELEVDETLKGHSQKYDRMKLTMYGGTVDGITTIVVGAPNFTLGERSVLFLLETQSAQFGRNFGVVGLSQGKFDIFIDQATQEEKVVRDQTGFPLQLEKAGPRLALTNTLALPLGDFVKHIKTYVNSR
jgi:hypothetical protein